MESDVQFVSGVVMVIRWLTFLIMIAVLAVLSGTHRALSGFGPRPDGTVGVEGVVYERSGQPFRNGWLSIHRAENPQRAVGEEPQGELIARVRIGAGGQLWVSGLDPHQDVVFWDEGVGGEARYTTGSESVWGVEIRLSW